MPSEVRCLWWLTPLRQLERLERPWHAFDIITDRLVPRTQKAIAPSLPVIVYWQRRRRPRGTWAQSRGLGQNPRPYLNIGGCRIGIGRDVRSTSGCLGTVLCMTDHSLLHQGCHRWGNFTGVSVEQEQVTSTLHLCLL